MSGRETAAINIPEIRRELFLRGLRELKTMPAKDAAQWLARNGFTRQDMLDPKMNFAGTLKSALGSKEGAEVISQLSSIESENKAAA